MIIIRKRNQKLIFIMQCSHTLVVIENLLKNFTLQILNQPDFPEPNISKLIRKHEQILVHLIFNHRWRSAFNHKLLKRFSVFLKIHKIKLKPKTWFESVQILDHYF